MDVFKDHPDVDVVLVIRSGAVLRGHAVDDELLGQVLGELSSDDAGDFSSVSGLAVMWSTSRNWAAV